jgi:glycosyltransferase involved in cell wall biosynthesis
VSAAPPSRITVVRQGDTPIVNVELARLMRAVFPDHEVDDIDLLAELRRRPAVCGAVLLAASLERSVDLLRRRTEYKRAIVTSSAFTRFARRVVRRRVDPDATSFVIQSQSLFSADVPGVPHLVYTDHVHLANLGYPAFDRRRLLPASFLRREVELYQRCAAVLVRSTNIRDTLRYSYGIDPARVAVIGAGPNAPVGVPGERRWHGGRIIFVGLDWERKGGPVLLEAFERVRARHPSARLEIVGRSGGHDTPTGVTFHGRLPGTEVASLLRRSDVFCLPTRAEPFGVVFIEAMLAGLPVVGTALGAQTDFIVPGRTGELVPPDDPDALATALVRLVGDEQRTRRMGRCAAALAEERYTWAAVGARLRAAVDAALAAGVAPRTDRGRQPTEDEDEPVRGSA